VLIVPEDERELGEKSWADRVIVFTPSSLKELRTIADAIREPLSEAISDLGIAPGKIVVFEDEPICVPAPYVASYSSNIWLIDLLKKLTPFSAVLPASELLSELRAVLTTQEISRVQLACAIAAHAFELGRDEIREGLSETEIAAFFRMLLTSMRGGYEGLERADGELFCMSGPNSFQAFASFQQTRSRRLCRGDLVLIHCNSYVDGYWTDITRTFCLGPPDTRQVRMLESILEARAAALEAIKPGVKAAQVDTAARNILKHQCFESEFKHGLGHGVGFAAIDHNARPRLHPASDDVLETGMVLNIEPAIYIEGFGGMRHCDMVAVTETGAEVLTPFQAKASSLIVS
jgi:Xaa-Pro aminopeptidase